MLRNYHLYMRRRRFAPGTVAARISCARRYVTEVDWRGADFHEIEEWVYSHKITPRSQRNEIGYLKAFYRWALREGLVDRDPTGLVDAPRLPMLLPRPAPDAHIEHVLAGADVETAAVVVLMACGGLRCTEIAELRWCDVDLSEEWVHVMGKGRRERRIFLAPEVLAYLAALDGTEGPVFPAVLADGHRSAARISQLVCRTFRAAGFPTTAHQLRHRAATEAYKATGGNLLAVRDFLGHASVATTQIYTKLVPGEAARASRAVSLPGSRAA